MGEGTASGADQEKLVSFLDGNNFCISGTSEANKGEFNTLEVDGETGIDAEIEVGGSKFKFNKGILYEVD